MTRCPAVAHRHGRSSRAPRPPVSTDRQSFNALRAKPSRHDVLHWAHRHDGSALRILYLALPSGQIVLAYRVPRFAVRTKRHDAMSCTGLNVTTIVLAYTVSRIAVTTDRQLSTALQDKPSVIYRASRQTVATRCLALGSPSRRIVLMYIVPRLAVMTRCPAVAHRHDRSSLRIEYLALPS